MVVEHRLTTDPGNQYRPDIDGDKVVYFDTRGGSSAVYLYDLKTHSERRLASGGTGWPGSRVAISGTRVVYDDNRESDGDIYLCDLATGLERRLTSGPGQHLSPDISGDKVVYEEWPGYVYLYDLATDTETLLGGEPGWQSEPAVSGNRVVWVDSRHDYEGSGTNHELYVYDIAAKSENRLTHDEGWQQSTPDICGDKVVFVDDRNTNDDIYLHNLTTHAEKQITTDYDWQWTPKVSGNLVVWGDRRNRLLDQSGHVLVGYDIYAYDLASETEIQVTINPADQGDPAISGNRVVFTDARNGAEDIYLSEFVDARATSLSLRVSAPLQSPTTARRRSLGSCSTTSARRWRAVACGSRAGRSALRPGRFSARERPTPQGRIPSRRGPRSRRATGCASRARTPTCRPRVPPGR